MDKLNYLVSVELGGQIDIAGAVNKAVLPLLNQAVRAVAAATSASWQRSVANARLWSGEKNPYIESIKWKMDGDFSATISSDYKYAGQIETGRPGRDLKKMLDTSNKVRRTKDGRRFLVIPMRHNTPGNGSNAMPTSVHDLASAMTQSSIVSEGQRPSGQIMNLSPTTGMTAAAKQTPYLSSLATRQKASVTSRNYAWGDRLGVKDMKAAGIGAADRKRYGGMVRMDANGSGPKSSSFLTFRIMMEGSSGWVTKAQPGLYLAKGVAEEMQPKAEAAFQEAIKRTKL